VKPASFTYHCPHTLGEALELLASLENARPLAGGQSLVPMLNLRLATPDHLIDLGRIEELLSIEQTADGLALGAMTTQRAIERSALARALCPLLTEAIEHVGHQQTRNRGTIGGSLCHLDPAAELPLVAAALDATLIAASKSGRRRIRFADFPAGYLTSHLRHDEIVTRVEFPALRAGTGWAFVEFARRPADFAIAAAAVVLSIDGSDSIREARIAVGGLGPAPLRIETAEKALIGQTCRNALLASASAVVAACPAEGDALYPPDYRRELAAVMTKRALEKAATRARSAAHV
jgi:aerobic carbon-monoxide dehydrogenase medium subunit